jgi:hypothetical protein
VVTFKQFLCEGGHATEKFGTERANAADIQQALEVVAGVLGVKPKNLERNLLGSGHLILSGHKQDSGDIDIALPEDGMERTHEAMLRAVGGKGTLNKGSKVGSYAVKSGDKLVQVDLMFVPDVEWAKFIYSSEHGRKSKYPGAVRNIILMAAVSLTQRPGEDVVVKNGDDIIAKASRSLKLQGGLERLFKAAKVKKDGTFSKTLDKVEPAEVAKHAKGAKFSPKADIITDPTAVLQWLFGKGVTPEMVETAEQVIALIKKRLPNATEVLRKAATELEKSKLPVPSELDVAR